MAGSRFRFLSTWWTGLFALYLLLVFTLNTAELVAGAVCAAVGATAAELVRSRGRVRFAPGLGWIRTLPALVAEVAVDTLRMVPLVWRALRGQPVHGRTRCVAFPAASLGGSEGSTRRAVEKFLGSVAPNSYVVGFDQEHDVVLVHQLVPTEEPPRVDWGVR